MSAFFLKHPKETDLALFAGGEAGPFARWRIERHLESCLQCERAVADFFHLAEELSVLGDTPDVDWNAIAAHIHARLAVEGPAAEPRRGVPAWTWQLGAAAACAAVIVTVVQIGPKGEPAYATRAEQAVADKAFEAEQMAAESRDERLAFNEAAPEPSAPELRRRVEAKKEAAEAESFTLADSAGSALSTDAVAPPPPVANWISPQTKPAAAPAEADAGVVAGAARGRAFAPAGGRAPAMLAAAESFRAEPVAFSVEPLPPAGADVRVGADGWISVRAVQADGSMTITDVYDPQ